MTELTLREPTLVHRDEEGRPSLVDPVTGEIWPLRALPDDGLVTLLLRLRELRTTLNEALDAVGETLIGRMDARATWTLNAAGTTLRSRSPEPQVTWNAEALRVDLMKLRRKGLIDAEAIEGAIKVVPKSYEPRKAGIVKLLKLGGEVAEVVNRHQIEVTEKRRVSVSNAPRI